MIVQLTPLFDPEIHCVHCGKPHNKNRRLYKNETLLRRYLKIPVEKFYYCSQKCGMCDIDQSVFSAEVQKITGWPSI